MRKRYVLGIGAAVILVLAGGVAAGRGSSSTPQPALVDVTECNDYAGWIAERALSENRADRTEDAKLQGRVPRTGTVDGLAEANQENARAVQAYRRCMARRGYKVWG